MRVSHLVLIAAIAAGTVGCSRNSLRQAQQSELHGDNASALDQYQNALSKTDDPHGRADILVRIGECLYRLDRMPEAFSSFQKATEADSKNNTARLRMGEMLLAAGSPDRAREQAMLVLGNLANDSDALALLGAAWAAAENPALAIQTYERVLEIDPKRVTVAVALADLYNRQDDPNKARAILDKASKSQPGSSMPLLALARLEEQQGNEQRAEDAYRRAVQAEDLPETNMRLAQFLQRGARIAESEQVLRRVDAQRRTYPVALADFQFSAGHPGDALERYRTALDASSRHTGSMRMFQMVEAHSSTSSVEHASVAARLFEAEISAASALKAPERAHVTTEISKRLENFRHVFDPATIAVLQAELALVENNIPGAKAFAASAVDLAPDSPATHYVAGLVDLHEGDADLAVARWRTAVELDSHFTPARLALAQSAIDNRDGETADEFARAVVRDEPGNYRGLILFARALLLQSKPTSAAVMAKRASSVDPSSVEPALLMGEAWLQMNLVAEALLNFERAVVSHPESEEAIDGLMRVYRRGTVSYAALEKMERLAKEPPVSSPLLEIAGRLYADRGWYREAMRALSKAVEIDPKRATAARILAQLQFSTGDIPSANASAVRAGGKSESILKAYRAQSIGESKQAIAQYERALREGDQTGVAANNLAWIYADQNSQLNRALQLAQDAVRLSPNNPAVLDTLGFVQLRRREYSAAVKTLETAARLALMKSSGIEHHVADQIRKHLSDAYLSTGETAAAFQLTQNRKLFPVK